MQPEVTLRDTFAAAALTGLLASDQYDQLVTPADYADTAYELADAMLRERCRAGADCPAPDNAANLDAAPAARAADASVESVAPQPTAHPHGTGDNHSASACDGADVLSTPDSGGLINRAAQGGQPPARSGESERRDAAQPDNGLAAGGPAHHTQEPVAWAVLLSDGQTYSRCDYRWEADAIAAALPANEGVTATVAPLYHSPQPTLTDAEREAIATAAAVCEGIGFDELPATLRGLLERLK